VSEKAAASLYRKARRLLASATEYDRKGVTLMAAQAGGLVWHSVASVLELQERDVADAIAGIQTQTPPDDVIEYKYGVDDDAIAACARVVALPLPPPRDAGERAHHARLAAALTATRSEFCGACQQPREDRRLQMCARCGLVHYCSAACQHAHWRHGHREACRPPCDFLHGDYVRICKPPGNSDKSCVDELQLLEKARRARAPRGGGRSSGTPRESGRASACLPTASRACSRSEQVLCLYGWPVSWGSRKGSAQGVLCGLAMLLRFIFSTYDCSHARAATFTTSVSSSDICFATVAARQGTQTCLQVKTRTNRSHSSSSPASQAALRTVAESVRTIPRVVRLHRLL
jgi:MYND finger